MSNETIEELRNRVEQLEEQQAELKQGAVDAQGRAWSVSDLINMGLTRRQALQAIAVIAGGATLGNAIQQAVGVASADPSTTDGDGDVGTPSNRVDVFADDIGANSVSTEQALFDAIQDWNDPTRESPLKILASESGAGILLQNRDDSVNNAAGKANVTWFSHGDATGDPEKLAAIGSHPADNELSFYTKSDAIGSGDSALYKRFDLEGGFEQTIARLNTSAADANVNLIFEQQGSPLWRFWARNDKSLSLLDNNGVNMLRIRPDFGFTFQGNPLWGLREISNPTVSDLNSQEWAWDATNSRWLYKDSGGTAHYFTPDGTL